MLNFNAGAQTGSPRARRLWEGRPPLEERRGAPAELGIGLHAELGLVEAVVFGFLGGPDAEEEFERESCREQGNEDEDADGEHADKVHLEIAAAEDADRERAPDTGNQMGRDGAHHIVDLQPVESRDRTPIQGT